MRFKKLYSLIIAILLINAVNGQEKPSPSLRQIADSLFNIGNFKSAMPIFEDLLNKFPQDPHYNFTLGVCYIQETRKIDKAIQLLKKASTADVPNLVYFYLAEAYRLSYRFNDAIDYYRRYTINGGSTKHKTEEIEKLVSSCENGGYVIKYLYNPAVIDKKAVPKSEFYKYYNLNETQGYLIPKPDDLKTAIDKKLGENSIISYPKNLEPGDFIYYSSYGNSASYGKDIFRIQFLEDGYWSKPENLGEIINSNDDEDYPYMDEKGQLYFASKGHYSIGGYDIYKSSYDSKLKKWTSPENIGFPLNSTYDDVLYISVIHDSLAYFASTRNTSNDSIDIILYKVEDNPIRKSNASLEEILKVVPLNPIKVKKETKLAIKEQPEVESKEIGETKNKLASVKKNPSFSSIENDPEYVRVIANGFKEQAKADSLRIKLEKLRAGFDNVNTAEERKKLESQVVKVEDALLNAQNFADQMFARASQIEQEYLTGKRKAGDYSDAEFASDNPEFLYQAQFASTVFRSDELRKLAGIEKLQPQLNKVREEVQVLKTKYESCIKSSADSGMKVCQNDQNILYARMNAYSDLVKQMYDVKYKIYSDCIMVALVKSGNNNAKDATLELNRANSHFRAASTILNNLAEEGKTEGLFEASLLNELGLMRMEIAFAKVWGINLFEVEVTSKVLRIEKFAFGSPLPSIAERKEKRVADVENRINIKKDEVKITLNNRETSVQPIIFKADEPPAFQVVESLPYNDSNPIPIDEPYPAGVFYKIQLAAFSKTPELSYYKGLMPITGEKVSGGKVIKYYVGRFKFFAEANKALSTVKMKGFKDAFISSWLDGKPIPVTRAQSIEDKQIKNPNSAIQDSTSTSTTIYLIQLGKFAGKLPDDIYQTVKTLAPGKDILRKQDNQGKYIYSISSYSNIEDATKIKENLIASGIGSAQIVTVEVGKK